MDESRKIGSEPDIKEIVREFENRPREEMSAALDDKSAESPIKVEVSTLLADGTSFDGERIVVHGILYHSPESRRYYLCSSEQVWENGDVYDNAILVYVGGLDVEPENLTEMHGYWVRVEGRFEGGTGGYSTSRDEVVYALNTAHPLGTIDAMSIIELER